MLDRPLDQKVRTLADLRETLSRSFDRHLGRVVWIHDVDPRESGERGGETLGGAGMERKWGYVGVGRRRTLVPRWNGFTSEPARRVSS